MNAAEMADTVFVLNGPNLDLLGVREPEIYGHATLGDIEAACRTRATGLGLTIEFRQTNAEHEMIGWIHAARTASAGIVINPAGWTTTSVAILDALLTCESPIVEVHLSNIHRREPFRTPSLVSRAARAVICGAGAHGYVLAIEYLASLR